MKTLTRIIGALLKTLTRIIGALLVGVGLAWGLATFSPADAQPTKQPKIGKETAPRSAEGWLP